MQKKTPTRNKHTTINIQ